MPKSTTGYLNRQSDRIFSKCSSTSRRPRSKIICRHSGGERKNSQVVVMKVTATTADEKPPPEIDDGLIYQGLLKKTTAWSSFLQSVQVFCYCKHAAAAGRFAILWRIVFEIDRTLIVESITPNRHFPRPVRLDFLPPVDDLIDPVKWEYPFIIFGKNSQVGHRPRQQIF